MPGLGIIRRILASTAFCLKQRDLCVEDYIYFMPEIPLTQAQYKRVISLIATSAGVLTALDRQNLLELAGLSEFVPP